MKSDCVRVQCHPKATRFSFELQLVAELNICLYFISFIADCAEIKVRMASVWYTHSPQFVTELQSCATEFKQYLTNVARSIKSAATEMAMGLVHAR
jgi:hypothetical protein